MNKPKFLGILLTVLAIGLIGVTGWAVTTFRVAVPTPTVDAGASFDLHATFEVNDGTGWAYVVVDTYAGFKYAATYVEVQVGASGYAETTGGAFTADTDIAGVLTFDVSLDTDNYPAQSDADTTGDYADDGADDIWTGKPLTINPLALAHIIVETNPSPVEWGRDFDLVLEGQDTYNNPVNADAFTGLEIISPFDGKVFGPVSDNFGTDGLYTATVTGGLSTIASHTLYVNMDNVAQLTPTVVVERRDTYLTGGATVVVAVGNTFTAEGWLKETTGDAAIDLTADFVDFNYGTAPEANVDTNASGYASTTFTAEGGKLSYTIDFAGNAQYEASVQVSVTVTLDKVVTSIVAVDRTVVAGAAFDAEATVQYDSDGDNTPDAPLVGVDVTFNYDADPQVAVTDGTGVATYTGYTGDTDVAGAATYTAAVAAQTMDPDGAGPSGTVDILGCDDTADVTLVPGALDHIHVALDPTSIEEGAAFDVEVTAHDANDNVATNLASLANLSITADKGAGTLRAAATANLTDGVFTYNQTAPSPLNDDGLTPYPVNVNADGVAQVSAQMTVTQPAAHTYVVTAADINATAGKVFTMSAYVTDGGVPAADGTTVDFIYGGSSEGTATTTGGTATLVSTSTAPIDVNAYTSLTYTAQIDGKPGTADDGAITVVADDASKISAVSFSPAPLYTGSAVDITVTFQDQYDNPAADQLLAADLVVVSEHHGEVARESSVTLDASGKTTVSISAGTIIKVDATHKFDFSCGVSITTTADLEVKATKKTTRIISVGTATGEAGTVGFDANNHMSATLEYEGSWLPLENAILKFTFQSQVDTDVTDVNGLGTTDTSATLPTEPGFYTYTVEFEAETVGSVEYLGCGPMTGTARVYVTNDPALAVAMSSGWNLFSVPEEPKDQAAATVFGGHLNATFRWNTATGQYDQGTDVGDVVAENGYWMYTSQLFDFTITDTVPLTSDKTLTIPAGTGQRWVMFGVPFAVGWDDGITVESGGTYDLSGAHSAEILHKYIWGGWDGTAYGEYGPGDVLNPRVGYWLLIKTDDAVTLTFPYNPAAKPTTPLGLSTSRHVETNISPPPPPNAALMQSIELNAISTAQGVLFEASGISGIEALSVEVFNLAGELVYAGSAQGASLNWSAQGVANGVYLYVPQVKIGADWLSLGLNKLLILR